MCGAAERKGGRVYTREFTPEEIKQALIDQYDHTEPLGELILAGQAAFDLISHLDIELEVKDAFHQLEKRFEFYKNLLEQ